MALEKIHDIPLSEIKIAGTNIRHTDADKDLDELAASIKKHGLLQPVVLIGEYGHPPYELIVGQRRFLAHKKLGKHTIRVIFAGKLSKEQASIRSLAENLLRVDVNHADVAKAVTELYKHFKKDEHKVAAETGMSLQKIRQYIYIEERASENMKQKLRNRKVSPVDVQRALRAAVGDNEKADRLLNKMQQYQLTKYQKARLVEYGETHPRASEEKILEEAQRQRVERTILVKLSDRAREGLEQAAKKMAMSPDEVAAHALEDWLLRKGFLSGK